MRYLQALQNFGHLYSTIFRYALPDVKTAPFDEEGRFLLINCGSTQASQALTGALVVQLDDVFWYLCRLFITNSFAMASPLLVCCGLYWAIC